MTISTYISADDAEHLHTLRDFLRYAVSSLNASGASFGHGCADAYDEAAYLILHTLHLPLDRLEPFLDALLTDREREQLIEVLSRRVDQRIPAAYLTREAWLGDFRFYVDERVLVPRSFIAELLENGLAPWVEAADEVGSILDLCTGSGCLAILAAHAFPNAAVDAADISPDALEVARRNVHDYALEDQIQVVETDLFQNLLGRRYDLILSNPPYVTDAAMANLPQEYRQEPALGLAGGHDGMDVVRRMLASAAIHLNPGGLLVVEVGHNRAETEAAFPELPFTWLATRSSEDMVFLLHQDDLAP